jgi:hypothetical protein
VNLPIPAVSGMSVTVQTPVVESKVETLKLIEMDVGVVSMEFGKWYIVGTCSHCGGRMPLFEDLSEGKSKLVGTFVTRCPKCDMQTDLKPEHYLHQSPAAEAEA